MAALALKDAFIRPSRAEAARVEPEDLNGFTGILVSAVLSAALWSVIGVMTFAAVQIL